MTIGNIRGIFVTTKGYQSGAITYAEENGIILKTVQNPTEEDIKYYNKGYIKNVCVEIHAPCINNVVMEFVWDMDWILDNTVIKLGDSLSFNGSNHEFRIVESNGILLGTLWDY
jgi:hypothetical protein